MFKYEHEIKTISKKYGIDPDLTRAIIQNESNFKPNLKTPEYRDGKKIGYSYGLMQVLDSTARIFGIKKTDLLFNPVINITVGVMYLSDLSRRYKKLNLIIASYNAGRPKFAKGFPVRFINQVYVDKVMKEYNKLKFQKYLPVFFAFAVGYLVYGRGDTRVKEGVKSGAVEFIRQGIL